MAVTSLTTENSILTEKVLFYDNCLSNKDGDNGALKKVVKNLQGEVKNPKYDNAVLKMQVTPEAPAPWSRTRADLISNRNTKVNLTTLPGGPLLTFGAMVQCNRENKVHKE